MIHVISLGAGVQSSTMALMAAHGEIEPMPRCAVFADTGWEPKAVYAWLDDLERMLPFPVHRVGKGNLREEQVTARIRGHKADGAERWSSIPYFTRDRVTESPGMVRRQCTSEYKIRPIETFLKQKILGLAKGQRSPKTPVITQWRGISADEASRMKPSRERWLTVRYPLAMEHRMTRGDCLAWMERKGYPRPPRSACIGCPFHSDHEWREMRDQRPEEWADAVEFDEAIRSAEGMRGDTYLHAQRIPLAQVDLDSKHQSLSLWPNECEGMCGV